MDEQKKDMMIICTPCYKCNKDMLVALVGDDSGNMNYGPESFNPQEIALAKKNAVLLKNVNSKTAEESYLANICGGCGAFIGKWYYFANYYTEALYGRLKYRRV